MRRRYKEGTGIGIIVFVVLILFAIVTYRRIGLSEEKDKAQVNLTRLDAQIQKEKERQTDIENFREHTKTQEYIEEIAREKLGLVYEDEIIFEPEE